MFKGETILGQFELPYIEDSLSYDVVESYLDLTTIKIKVDSNPYIKDCILNKINKQQRKYNINLKSSTNLIMSQIFKELSDKMSTLDLFTKLYALSIEGTAFRDILNNWLNSYMSIYVDKAIYYFISSEYQNSIISSKATLYNIDINKTSTTSLDKVLQDIAEDYFSDIYQRIEDNIIEEKVDATYIKRYYSLIKAHKCLDVKIR